MAGATSTPRERYRDQVRAEVKQQAWEQIATAGASALSLNAIAKRMGLSGPALYRYYAGRDELITELIRDAYDSLAGAFRTAAATSPGLAPLGHALRDWALADPQRYLLLYGTPVPGYHAPAETTAIASDIMAVLLDAAGATPSADTGAPSDDPLTGHLAEHGTWADGHPATPADLRRALTFWTRLHGVVSLELAGHFTGMGFDPEVLFAAELAELAGPTDA